MKTKQISTGLANLLLVELPEGAENAIGIGFNELGTLEFYTPQLDAPPMLQALYKLNVGSNWQLLCSATEMTDGIAEGVVLATQCKTYYFDYGDQDPQFDKMHAKALESWNSLIQASDISWNVWEINRTYIFKQV